LVAFKVFDISAQGEAPTDAAPVLVFQAEE